MYPDRKDTLRSFDEKTAEKIIACVKKFWGGNAKHTRTVSIDQHHYGEFWVEFKVRGEFDVRAVCNGGLAWVIGYNGTIRWLYEFAKTEFVWADIASPEYIRGNLKLIDSLLLSPNVYTQFIQK